MMNKHKPIMAMKGLRTSCALCSVLTLLCLTGCGDSAGNQPAASRPMRIVLPDMPVSTAAPGTATDTVVSSDKPGKPLDATPAYLPPAHKLLPGLMPGHQSATP